MGVTERKVVNHLFVTHVLDSISRGPPSRHKESAARGGDEVVGGVGGAVRVHDGYVEFPRCVVEITSASGSDGYTTAPYDDTERQGSLVCYEASF